MGFTKDFVWGSATAAIQVEGAALEYGKGMDIWTTFSKKQGAVYQGHTPLISCDQYHHLKEDVALMKEMGLQAYRFSISWSRVLPEGTGRINEEGIAYYNRLIDLLLEHGIEPYITMYHWDLPEELQIKGGWVNPEIVAWFQEYAELLTERFSDRVKNWMTLNEPACFSGLGYLEGFHAPGLKVNTKEFFQVVHHLLCAHGIAAKVLRKNAKQPVKISIALNGGYYYPEKNCSKDIEAARREMFSCKNDIHGDVWNIALLADPIYLGTYPEDVLNCYKDVMPNFTKEDMELISQPLDFVCINIYNGVMMKADDHGNPVRVERYEGFPKTAIQWPVTPECMYWAPKFLYERYHKPIIIAENGMSSHDWVCLDGKVHDNERTDFIHRYLLELKRAANDQIPIAGYFMWSFIDNFEWTEGYNERFGIVYVDYTTQNRVRKDSSYFYQETIKANGENL